MSNGVIMKLWNRDFLFIFIANFFNANSFYIIIAILPLFITRELMLSPSKVGFAMASFSITAVAVRPFVGNLLDIFGRVKILRPGLILYTVAIGLYFFVNSLQSLIALRLMHGFAWGIFGTSGSTVAADIVPKERRAEGLGYYAVAMSIGMALGPLIGIVLLDNFSFEKAFLSGLIFAIIALICGFMVKVPDFQKKTSTIALKDLFEKKVAGVALMNYFYGFSYAGLMSYIILYGESIKIENTGMYFLIYAFFMSAVRPFAGKYVDKNGPRDALGAGMFLLIVSFVCLYFATDNSLYFLSAGIMGIGSGIVSPLLLSMAMNLVPQNKRGIANATVFSAFDIGIACGSALLGIISEATSLRTIYLVSALILFIPVIYFYKSGYKSYKQNML